MRKRMLETLEYPLLMERVNNRYPAGDDKQNLMRWRAFDIARSFIRNTDFPEDDDELWRQVRLHLDSLGIHFFPPETSRNMTPFGRPEPNEPGFRVTLKVLVAACEEQYPGCGQRLARVLWRQYTRLRIRNDGRSRRVWRLKHRRDVVRRAIDSEKDWAWKFYWNKVTV